MKFRNKDSIISIMDRENMELAVEYFIKVFNRDTIVDQEYIDKTRQKPIISKIRRIVKQEEFNIALEKLTQNKVLGINGILLNILK